MLCFQLGVLGLFALFLQGSENERYASRSMYSDIVFIVVLQKLQSSWTVP